jgi:hypothetical protein
MQRDIAYSHICRGIINPLGSAIHDASLQQLKLPCKRVVRGRFVVSGFAIDVLFKPKVWHADLRS